MPNHERLRGVIDLLTRPPASVSPDVRVDDRKGWYSGKLPIVSQKGDCRSIYDKKLVQAMEMDIQVIHVNGKAVAETQNFLEQKWFSDGYVIH